MEKNIKEYLFSQIINLLPGHVWWTDTEGRLLGCNDEMLQSFGAVNKEDLLGKDSSWVNTPEQVAHIKEVDHKVLTTGMSVTEEEPGILSSGERAVFLSKKSPLKNSAGEIEGVLGIALDITELKNTQEKLKEAKKKAEVASQAKSEFITNMSHDIRTPITGVMGMLEDLLYTVKDAQQQIPTTFAEQAKLFRDFIIHTKRNASVALGSTDELLGLCNEILKVMRLESGSVHTSAESFNLQELIQHNINFLQSVALHKKLDLLANIDERVPVYLNGLRRCLERTLLNISSNALKFTEKGHVQITVTVIDPAPTYAKGDKVILQIKIEDTGIGIPKEKINDIFTHFTRLTPSYEGNYKGYGLGLYTVKRHVEEMKGKVEVDSTVGKGSCFTLTLPFTVDDHTDPIVHAPKSPVKTVPAPQSPTQPNTAATSKATTEHVAHVLVVEDSPPAAMAARMLLQRLECAVDVAENGAKAIEKASCVNYDLILLDIGLPDTTGLEVAKIIRELSDVKKANVPIVALTGHAGEDKRRECLSAGMNDVLTKPADLPKLQATLQQWVLSQAPKST